MNFILSDNFSPGPERNGLRTLGFMTSADVVMKASGLRIEAIKVIAREQGIEIEDSESRCIDENLLSLLADAHIRRLKSYFKNSKRQITEFSGAEFSAFIDFCQTFKKHQITTANSWEDIDTDAIREQFYRKVHELTPHRNLLDSLFGAIFVEASMPHSKELTLDDFERQCIEQRQDYAMSKFLESCWLFVRVQPCHSYDKDVRPDIRRTTLSARYYVFTDDDDHQSDAASSNGQQDYIINRIQQDGRINNDNSEGYTKYLNYEEKIPFTTKDNYRCKGSVL